jgi:hypothetical protein
MMSIRNPKDFWSGARFIAPASRRSRELEIRARFRGRRSGYFPRILGILLIVLGGILAVRAMRTVGPPMPPFRWRPTIVVLGSVAFGAIVRIVGVARRR